MRALLLGLGAVFAIASSAQAAANGVWRCSAQGNIPLGVLTIKPGGYTYQAVRNTAWEAKAGDASTGSGVITVTGAKIAVASGPLRTRMKVATGVYETTTSPNSANYEYIDLYDDPNAAYLLRCYRP